MNGLIYMRAVFYREICMYIYTYMNMYGYIHIYAQRSNSMKCCDAPTDGNTACKANESQTS